MQYGYDEAMRVVVVGATGNAGTAVLEVLDKLPSVTDVLAVARRLPSPPQRPAHDKVSWQQADLGDDELEPLFSEADVVVHLAWLFQPTHRPDDTWANNVIGTSRVLQAVKRCAVPAFIYSSSVGAYSPRTSSDLVDESWPTHGTSSASYAREKAYVERLLDIFEADTPSCRVVRMRPAFIFHRRTATQQRRLFGGPLVPGRLVRPSLVPVLPVPAGLLLQTLHSDDVAEAFGAAVVSDVSGPFNLCADGIVEPADIAKLFDARVATVPATLTRGALKAAWLAHAVPATPQLLDAALAVPMMDNARAKDALGWQPQMSPVDALEEFFIGLRGGEGHPTPPLDPESGGPLRSEEFGSGVGEQD